MTPGSDVDHRGTTFDEPLLIELLAALRDPTTYRPHLGNARFDHATFSAHARFDRATFSADARFDRATFSAHAGFGGATFSANVRFDHATFSAHARFDRATFSAHARFDRATFSAHARFDRATFSAHAGFGSATFSTNARFEHATFSANAGFGGATFSAHARFDKATFSAEAGFDGAIFAADARFDSAAFSAHARFNYATFFTHAWFDHATFSADARFDHVTFSAHARFEHATFSTNAGFGYVVVGGDAGFRGVRFESASVLGPLWCWGVLDLSGAVFAAPVVIEAAAARMWCVRTRWEATATLRLWHATLDMNGAVLNFPLAVVSAAGETDPVQVETIGGVDAAHLVLTDTDLTTCRFLGAFHLDQLRLEGDTRFARTPTGTDPLRGVPLRWTGRLVLAEEHHWRALPLPGRRPRQRAGWTPAPPHPTGSAPTIPGPAALAALYRQLRKTFEDGKDEPGAADFYMGEMEMRRLDRRPGRSRAERGLLTAYWALSGYGLRASRALAWLGLAMTTTVLAMMLWGLPTSDPKPKVTGTLPAAGQAVDLTVDTGDPTLTGTTHDHLTGIRAEKATRVVLNSVVFRSSGQNLTTAGTYIEMTSRFLEPVLLGLAALAIRGRVKR